MSIYVPPALNAVDFALTAHTVPSIASPAQVLSAYTVPALNAVDFDLTAYTVPTYMDIGWELLPSVGPVDYTLICAVGSYVYTGQSASLTVARQLALDAGAYAYAGNDAVLDYVPGGVDYVLACDSGAYVYTGQDATLAYRAGVTVPLGGHFAFDEKKRGKRWKKEKEERDRRREVLVEAFQGLPAEVKPVAVEAITGTPAVTIDWAPIVEDLNKFHAALMQMAIAKAARQDEDDIAELIEMGVL